MMMTKIKQFLQDETAATAIEYGLLATLIAVAIVGGATALGSRTNTNFTCMNNMVNKTFKDDGFGPCAPFESNG